MKMRLRRCLLRASGNELFYYTFPTESGKHNYEIDFLLSRHNKLCPLEVKSSGYKSHVSLDVFYSKYSNRISERYLVYGKDLFRQDGVSYVPFYMVQFL